MDYQWRATINAAAAAPGALRITARPKTIDGATASWVKIALDRYEMAYGAADNKVASEIDVYRAALDRDRLFEIRVSTYGPNHAAFSQALGCDFHPLAFANAVSSVITDPDSDIETQISRWATLEELVECLAPPFTFGDPIVGMDHFSPNPFPVRLQHRKHSEDSISLGTAADSIDKVDFAVQSFCRHVAVTGAPGSGKSTFIKHLIKSLHSSGIFSLIIDPVKVGDFDLLIAAIGASVYDFGYDPTRWLHFNPFLPPPKTPLYQHAGLLTQAFSLLTPTNAVAGDLLARFVIATYKSRLTQVYGDRTPPLMHLTGAHLYNDHRLIPTFEDFLRTTLTELERLPAQGSSWTTDTFGYFKRKMDSMAETALYRVFTIPKGPITGDRGEFAPVYHLFNKSALLQLQALTYARPEEADTLFLLITGLLTEYRQNEGLSDRLKHVLVLEEAHRVMPSHQKSLGRDYPSSPKEESARAAAGMLAEARGYGQGVILVDQTPNAVLPEALATTSSRFFFRPKDGLNKEVISQALGLSPDEADYLVTMPRGRALAELADESRPFVLDTFPPAANGLPAEVGK